LVDTGNTSNTQLALGVDNGIPIVAWTGTDSDNALNVEFLSTSVPGVVLTPQSLTISGDQGAPGQPDFVVIGTQPGGLQVTVSAGPAGSGVMQPFAAGSMTNAALRPLGGNNTVVVNGVPQGVTVTIESTGSDYIDVGNGSLGDVRGSVVVTGSGSAFLQLD